jgi:hypothetical protein
VAKEHPSTENQETSLSKAASSSRRLPQVHDKEKQTEWPVRAVYPGTENGWIERMSWNLTWQPDAPEAERLPSEKMSDQ